MTITVQFATALNKTPFIIYLLNGFCDNKLALNNVKTM
jgi:hypothetical protein